MLASRHHGNLNLCASNKVFALELRPLSHNDQVIASRCFFCPGDDAAPVSSAICRILVLIQRQVYLTSISCEFV